MPDYRPMFDFKYLTSSFKKKKQQLSVSSTECSIIGRIKALSHITVGDKNSLGAGGRGGQTKFVVIFFICPNMTDLVGKFHVINYLN